MLWKNKIPKTETSANILAAVVEETLKKPVSFPVTTKYECHDRRDLYEYEQMAASIRFLPAQLLQANLLAFFSENNISLFDNNEVDKYLKKKCPRGKSWIWRPLRNEDKPAGWVIGGREYHGSVLVSHGCYRDEWEYRPYDKGVPLHILSQVKQMQDQFGSQILFFVSDYAVSKPDPFIMVTALDVDILIFGMWDEPGFGINITS